MNIQTNIQHRLKLLLCGILLGSSAAVQAAPATFTVLNLLDSGAGSLRQAITDSNGNVPGAGFFNTIVFSPTGTGTINITSTSLPTITQPVLINGYTGTGALPNTNNIGLSNNAVITVQVNGLGALQGNTTLLNGFTLGSGSSGSIIQGLSITNFAALNNAGVLGIGIEILPGSSGNSIAGNFIGVAPDGNTSLPNGVGIQIDGASANNTIGGTNVSLTTTQGGRNLIAGHYFGNGNNAVVRTSGLNTVIQGNTIGINRAGTTVVMPDAVFGIACTAPQSGGIIGGLGANQGNVIAGHSGANIVIRSSTNTLVQGNFVGTNVAGTAVILTAGDSLMPNGQGICLSTPSNNGSIQNITVDSNLVSGNTWGISVGMSTPNRFPLTGVAVTNNLVGTNAAGTAAIPNALDGIIVRFAQATVIGGNVVCANGRHGINIQKSRLSLVKGNLIGVLPNGNPLGNGAGFNFAPGVGGNILPGGDGIRIGSQGVGVASMCDVIGGAKLTPVTYTTNSNGEGNKIQYNVGCGIKTVGFVRETQIQGNLITNNGSDGVQLNRGAENINVGGYINAGNVRIMGDIASQGNTVVWGGPLGTSNTIQNNGDAGDGIKLTNANNNSLQANIIEANNGAGIELIDSSFNMVGSKDPANSALLAPFLNIPDPLGNLIDGNTGGPGVAVVQQDGEAVYNAILTNEIFGNSKDGEPTDAIEFEPQNNVNLTACLSRHSRSS